MELQRSESSITNDIILDSDQFSTLVHTVMLDIAIPSSVYETTYIYKSMVFRVVLHNSKTYIEILN